MELATAIETRRTVRMFQRRPIAQDLLQRVVRAALFAPNPHNAQTWRFDVVAGSKRDELVKIIRQFPSYMADLLATYPADLREFVLEFSQDLGGAPVLVVISVPTMGDTHVHKIDLIAASTALQNLQLAAWNEGLGCVCLTNALWVEADIVRFLGLEQREIVTVVPMGYPSAIPEISPRRDDVVHWLGFDDN
ncbi:MAG: nitroreductase family protein [Chloroflexota bacterium]|nr:MAG: nitroreductase family protein [Chloroflexota bacterium]